MTVRDLIEYLKTFDSNLPVCYRCFSEQCLMEPTRIVVENLPPARADGWVTNRRPDVDNITYLVFPGN